MTEPTGPAETVVEVDTSAPGTAISPDLFGVFFEDINYAADGGLYAELVQNRVTSGRGCATRVSTASPSGRANAMTSASSPAWRTAPRTVWWRGSRAGTAAGSWARRGWVRSTGPGSSTQR